MLVQFSSSLVPLWSPWLRVGMFPDVYSQISSSRVHHRPPLLSLQTEICHRTPTTLTSPPRPAGPNGFDSAGRPDIFCKDTTETLVKRLLLVPEVLCQICSISGVVTMVTTVRTWYRKTTRVVSSSASVWSSLCLFPHWPVWPETWTQPHPPPTRPPTLTISKTKMTWLPRQQEAVNATSSQCSHLKWVFKIIQKN